MELLKNRITKDGKVIGSDVLKVDSFLNHQIDVKLFKEIGKEFKKRFDKKEITKILTIESSGIGIACITAQYFDVPVVFAKKHAGTNMDKDSFQSEVFSFTKGKSYNVRVSKKYILPEDKVLIIDDFLANANAASGLIDIINQADAKVVGVGIVIEKGFQQGRKIIEDQNIQLESLAIIESMRDGKIVFKN
ncbi:xanthine phosphoribosyltransferase [Clostridium brassicae]|uniref:Xanthine phosphoribosyltransferase n=1 Tax=Clostridium brassicae TaxID=2999072 RepID=A0ABT4D729_9CLOT|nr:xanthine phosphoribosyltransferase [Clostridium brassicae]MCY6957046.1 xanthine phosphoribosyltransferase [Clostridium brassicae]